MRYSAIVFSILLFCSARPAIAYTYSFTIANSVEDSVSDSLAWEKLYNTGNEERRKKASVQAAISVMLRTSDYPVAILAATYMRLSTIEFVLDELEEAKFHDPRN